MISFYKPTPKVTGTALSFYLNKRDNSFFCNLIKQDSWDSSRKIGSFQKNKKVEGKNVNVKFSPTEIASFIDCIGRNTTIEGYHGSNQIVRFSFGPYIPKKKTEEGEWVEGKVQKGFSFRVTRESKEDSTNKSSYVIGLDFGESTLLKEHLSYLLKESFRITDKRMEDSFKKKYQAEEPQPFIAVQKDSGMEEDDDDLW